MVTGQLFQCHSDWMRNRQYQKLNWKTLSDPLMVFDAHMLSAAHQAGRFPCNDACVCVCVFVGVCEWVRTRFPGVRTNQNEEKNGSRQKIIKSASRNEGAERPSKKLRQRKNKLEAQFQFSFLLWRHYQTRKWMETFTVSSVHRFFNGRSIKLHSLNPNLWKSKQPPFIEWGVPGWGEHLL